MERANSTKHHQGDLQVSKDSKEYVVQCLGELTCGGTLLKAGRSVSLFPSMLSMLRLENAWRMPCQSYLIPSQGRNHFRRFCLTTDLTRLTWESNKRADAAVLISQINELKLGQNTPNFKRNPLPECEVSCEPYRANSDLSVCVYL